MVLVFGPMVGVFVYYVGSPSRQSREKGREQGAQGRNMRGMEVGRRVREQGEREGTVKAGREEDEGL